MTKKQSLGDHLLQINGVKEYIFVRNDGYIIGHSMSGFDNISKMVAFAGLSCEGIKSVIGNTYFKYFSLIRKNQEKFFIFPLDRYYLGLSLSEDAYPPEIIRDVFRLTRRVMAQKNKPAA